MPSTVPVKDIAVMGLPEQTVWDVFTVATVGVGLTVIEAVIVGPLHPFALGLIVNTVV